LIRLTLYLLFAALIGVAAGEAFLRAYFPEPVAVDGCCEGWEPCPGRLPEMVAGRQYQWYCGPSRLKFAEVPNAGTATGRTMELDAGTATRNASSGFRGGGSGLADAGGSHF
jgi:hypothetical protein